MSDNDPIGMAHDQITLEEAERRGLVAAAVFLGDEVDGVGSWWHEGAQRFWIAPMPPWHTKHPHLDERWTLVQPVR